MRNNSFTASEIVVDNEKSPQGKQTCYIRIKRHPARQQKTEGELERVRTRKGSQRSVTRDGPHCQAFQPKAMHRDSRFPN